MNKGRTNDYIRVFKSLISKARKHGISLNHKSSMFDFEIGAIRAFQIVFTNSKAKCCLFHFSQNLMRKLDKICLKTIYIDNKE